MILLRNRELFNFVIFSESDDCERKCTRIELKYNILLFQFLYNKKDFGKKKIQTDLFIFWDNEKRVSQFRAIFSFTQIKIKFLFLYKPSVNSLISFQNKMQSSQKNHENNQKELTKRPPFAPFVTNTWRR